MLWLTKLGVCIVTVAVSVYIYMNEHNKVIEMQLAIPPLQKNLRLILAENDRLQFEIDRFESPSHLMKLAEKPEFRHLKFPYSSEVIVIPVSE